MVIILSYIRRTNIPFCLNWLLAFLGNSYIKHHLSGGIVTFKDNLTLEQCGFGGPDLFSSPKSMYNFTLSSPSPSLCITGQPTIGHVLLYCMFAGGKKIMCISGPAKFKPMLFKGVLCTRVANFKVKKLQIFGGEDSLEKYVKAHVHKETLWC